jgi:MraZ protein
MFRGNHPTRVDEKGRVKVPADFKRVLDERYGAEFYITSKDGKIAKVYPMDEWVKIEQKIMANPTEGVKKFLDTTSFWGQTVEIDGQGRLLLPGLLREEANLKGDVAVVGVLNHLEVRVMDDYRKQITEQKLTPDDDKALAQLGIW